MMVDIHDEYRPTGFSRTYPNLMTQEGIRENEEMPDATHNTILPLYFRFLAAQEIIHSVILIVAWKTPKHINWHGSRILQSLQFMFGMIILL